MGLRGGSWSCSPPRWLGDERLVSGVTERDSCGGSGQSPDDGRSRRLNSASRSVQSAAARRAWRTIHGSTRLESSIVSSRPDRAVLDDDARAVAVVGHPVRLQLQRDVGDDRDRERASRGSVALSRSAMSARRIGRPALDTGEQVDHPEGRERIARLPDRGWRRSPGRAARRARDATARGRWSREVRRSRSGDLRVGYWGLRESTRIARRSFTSTHRPCPEPFWGILARAGQPSGAQPATSAGTSVKTARVRCHPWIPTGSRPNRPPATSRRV